MKNNHSITRYFLGVLFPLIAQNLCMGQLLLQPTSTQQLAIIKDAVIMVVSTRQSYNYTTPWKQTSPKKGTGTGFVISGNRILTNAHNISDVRYVEVKRQNQAKRYPASVSFVAHDCDLAILTVDAPEFFDGIIPLQIGDLPNANTTVNTFGFPVGGQHISVTEGVISRIQVSVYSHPVGDVHLVVQTDAAINPGNSGGPVMQNGKVVGVAFQGLTQADNIGFMIPTTVINHFLEDIDDGHYDKYGSLGFGFFLGLHNKTYKAYLNVPNNENGIIVISTQLGSSIDGVLQPNDVITNIDGHNIDNDGMIQIHGLRLMLSETIEIKQLGELINITYFRDGQKKTYLATIALNRPLIESSRTYDIPPDYVIYGGLTFVTVNRNLLETWGSNWYTSLPHGLKFTYQYAADFNTNKDRKSYIVISSILTDNVNLYADAFKNQVIESINGKEILSLTDVAESTKNDVDGYTEIRFVGNSKPLIINARKAKESHAQIMEKYKVPHEKRITPTKRL